MGDMEQETCLERRLVAFETLALGLVVQTESVEAGGLVNMIVFVKVFLAHELVVDLNGLLVVAVVEVDVGQPLTVLDIDLGEAFLVFQESDSADPVALGSIVFQLWNFLFLLFHSDVKSDGRLLVLFSL